MIETLGGGGGGHSEYLSGHLRKVDPNESGNLDRFAFVRWYGGKEVSLDSAEEAEHLVCCGVQCQPGGSSVSNIFYSSFIEEGVGEINDIFE